ncbi:hypothetical protein BU24DRAFT_110479 [Aaosphaeria arxii CBS 175.79]|uniref:RRM domain-containing protein n=1 Tax=Aaosphaeria arxii CBS 175.79 TaxID=1450172 RepID=A0A6A5Y2F8_9PLEO|nr:uncharacterized protein BU24DRAFT_110479 [Aaosphaeria arxii CBS 175.79]KAF2019010.1 hypothetical protein BU24DRAFT_110479 [Aaosphaeria arxii CBS 175.79]
MARGDPFPKDPALFHSDGRCTYTPSQDKWVLLDGNGEEWEWNRPSGKWFQPATEEQIAAYQQAYGGPVNDEDQDAPQQPKNKRKQEPAAPEASSKKAKAVKENRAIYISNLPLDTTYEEIEVAFGRFGIIDQGADGTKRVKLYTDDAGNFKGEALVVYFRKEAVNQAVNMADDYWFRSTDTSHLIYVKPAELSYKRHKGGEDANFVRRDKKANERNQAELNRKLAEWSDDDEEALKETYAPRSNKWANCVILNHMFTLAELEEDEDAITEIRDEVREEAEDYGVVTKVVLYDKEHEGIMCVRFKERKDAETYAKICNGREFNNRRVSAWQAEDRPRFKKSKATEVYSDESD